MAAMVADGSSPCKRSCRALYVSGARPPQHRDSTDGPEHGFSRRMLNRPRFRRLYALVAAVSCLTACPSKQPASEAAPPALPPPSAAPAGSTAPPAAASAGDEAIPRGQLPADVTPTAYELSLVLLPDEPRFSGVVRIKVELARERKLLWLHGKDLTVHEVVLEGATGALPIPGRFLQVDGEGVARVDLERPAPPGQYTLVLRYDAPWNTSLRGVHRVVESQLSYVFSQFEPTSARHAFPGFDEPRFKTPFDITMTVKKEHAAVSNTRVVSETLVAGERREVRFARTEKLPTYLLAFAAGPLDIVPAADIPPNELRKTPIPLRAVTARGKGAQVGDSLRRTAEILQVLERYFGVAYPYDKLDIIAVPDFASGAMENAGAITFREVLLLVDEKTAPQEQVRMSAAVIAHEVAHQWFGDLVTTRWWDDIWLNEAFATWLTYETIERWNPSHGAALTFVERGLSAMRPDSLASARRIRQPILSGHDIRNAFDAITYSKGAAVIGMFERWLGREPFRKGLQRFLEKFRFGVASAADFLASLSEGAGKDVSAPFLTFLDQPGVPLVELRPVCTAGSTEPAQLSVRQSRYLPLGSTAKPEGLWQLPLCVRFGIKEGAFVRDRKLCTLLTRAEELVTLPGTSGCPVWLHPNADGAGYYRFTLPQAGFAALRGVATSLSAAERMTLSDALLAGFHAGRVAPAEVLENAGWLASSPERRVAIAPMEFFREARRTLLPDEALGSLEAAAAALYRPVLAHVEGALGSLDFSRLLGAKSLEAPLFDSSAWAKEGKAELRLFLQEVLGFLAEVARDRGLRAELSRRALLYLGKDETKVVAAALEPDLVGLALRVAVEDGDDALFSRLAARLRAGPPAMLRSQLIAALAHTSRPDLAEKARGLVFDAKVRTNEIMQFLRPQLERRETREGAWTWLTRNADALFSRLPGSHAGYLPLLCARHCTQVRAAELEAFFGPRAAKLMGGPRNLQGGVEAIRLCASVKAAVADATRAAFAAAAAPSRSRGTP